MGGKHRGRKNLVWAPKQKHISYAFLRLDMQHPKRRPETWHKLEFDRLGYTMWPKQVGFWNAGDNWELTPEFSWCFYLYNRDKDLWTPNQNESTIIDLLPMVEINPTVCLPRILEIWSHHVKRFGPDHIIYNAVTQAFAFARDYNKALKTFTEMKNLGLQPNAQSYVNMMFAVHICKKPVLLAEKFWEEAVQRKVLRPILRMDYEFNMWMKQFERLGSFTSETGFLSCNEEGASPRPRNMWAIWGWDRVERKFLSRRDRIRAEATKQIAPGNQLFTTKLAPFERQPWYKYKGLFPWDYRGPILPFAVRELKKLQDSNLHLQEEIIPYEHCGKAIPT